MADLEFEFDDVREWIRRHHVELDMDIEDYEIERAFEIANDMRWPSMSAMGNAVIHLIVSLTDDLSGETLKVNIGGVARSYRPMSGRPGASFWASSEYGRRAMASVRMNPAIAVATMD